MFNGKGAFPITPPIVSFTGLVIGSGSTLIHMEAGLEASQQKCCGFIRLSSYIAPGNPNKTPFKGFYPFQVFVIFPIHTKPWSSLCKGMTKKQETLFQSDTLF